MIIGMSCEHSLGAHKLLQGFTKFYEVEKWPPGVPDALNPPEMDRVSSYLFTDLHKTARQTNIKDAQKHFRSVLGYEKKFQKISKLF
jgi:hypothetical protein